MKKRIRTFCCRNGVKKKLTLDDGYAIYQKQKANESNWIAFFRWNVSQKKEGVEERYFQRERLKQPLKFAAKEREGRAYHCRSRLEFRFFFFFLFFFSFRFASWTSPREFPSAIELSRVSITYVLSCQSQFISIFLSTKYFI